MGILAHFLRRHPAMCGSHGHFQAHAVSDCIGASRRSHRIIMGEIQVMRLPVKGTGKAGQSVFAPIHKLFPVILGAPRSGDPYFWAARKVVGSSCTDCGTNV